jgi:hypothetical protein
MGELVRDTALGRLLSTFGGHEALLVAVLVTAWLIIAAGLAVTLVAITPSEDRADAIRAVAEVLRALLPWSAWRRDPRGGPARRQDGPRHLGRPGRPRHAVRPRGPARRAPP